MLACAESFDDTVPVMLDGCGNGTDGYVSGGCQEIAVVVVVKVWFAFLIRIRLLDQRIPNPVPDLERLKQPAKNEQNKGITRFEELTKNSPEAGSSSGFRNRLQTHQKAWI